MEKDCYNSKRCEGLPSNPMHNICIFPDISMRNVACVIYLWVLSVIEHRQENIKAEAK